MTRPSAVAVVHHEPLVADALATALDRYPKLLPTVLRTVEEVVTRRIDAAALDASLPGATAAASVLRRRGVRVVVLSAEEREGEVEPGSVSALAAALVPEAAAPQRVDALSSREREVIALAAKGLAGKQIAATLGISPKTVEAHKSHIFAKLGVSGQTAAAAIFTSMGGTGWSP